MRLVPLTVEHAAHLHVAASEDPSSYFYTFVPSDAEGMSRYVQIALSEHRAGRALPFAVERLADGAVVGSTRFMDIDHWVTPFQPGTVDLSAPPKSVEIGATWYAASSQRTGVNTESKRLLLEYAFETWRVERVSFKTDARNSRSRAAIERIGASYEGDRRAHHWASDGTIRDSSFYSILRSEWPDVRRRLEVLAQR